MSLRKNPGLPSRLSNQQAIFLFGIVILSWGSMWIVIKTMVAEVTPLWIIAIRNGIAAIGLFLILALTKQFVFPRRGDWSIILIISLFHMTAFAVLMTIGLQNVPVGRSIVLGYTTPLWVAPAARFLLKEPMPARRIAGVFLGLLGIGLLFNPIAFNWHNSQAVIGNGLLLLASVSWSVSIIYTRAHQWVSRPIQLVPWQAFISSLVLVVIAIILEGKPHIALSPKLLLAFGYCSIIGVVVAYWAMAIVNSILPATTTALGMLATPIVGMLASIIVLGESLDNLLLISTVIIMCGILVGTIAPSRRKKITLPTTLNR